MRGSRTLVYYVAAVAAAGLLVEAAAEAASFGMLKAKKSSAPTTGATASVAASTPASALASVGREAVAAALTALAPGGATLAGPGHFLGRVDDETRIYEVLGGAALDVCVTLRNLSSTTIRVSATAAVSLDVDAGETRAACYAAPTVIEVECRDGAGCEGVWRVDRQ